MNDENQQEYNLALLYRLLSRHKAFIVLFVLGFNVLLMAYSYVAKHKYAAEASALPPEEESGSGLSGFLQSMSGGLSGLGGGSNDQVKIIEEIFQSRTLAAELDKKLNLSERLDLDTTSKIDLYDEISQMFTIDTKNSGMIYVGATTSTQMFPNKKDKREAAEIAAEMANEAIVAVNRIYAEKNTSKARKRRILIEDILTQKKNTLDSIDAELEVFRKQNKVFSLEDQAQAVINNAVAIGEALAESQVELALVSNEFAPNSPYVTYLKRKVADLTEQYDAVQKGGLTENDEFSIPLENVPNLARKYRNLAREQEILEQVNVYLETQRYQEVIEEAGDAPSIEPLDPAIIPEKKSAPHRLSLLIIGLFVSSVFAAGTVVYRAYRKGGRILQESD